MYRAIVGSQDNEVRAQGIESHEIGASSDGESDEEDDDSDDEQDDSDGSPSDMYGDEADSKSGGETVKKTARDQSARMNTARVRQKKRAKQCMAVKK